MNLFETISNSRFHQNLKHFFDENEFLLLLIALLSFLLIPSFIVHSGVKSGVIYGLLVLVLLIGIYEISESKILCRIGILLSILTLLFNSLSFSQNDPLVFLLRMGSLIAFFGLLTIHVLIRMGKFEKVTTNVIYAAVNGYILIGLIGGMGFRLINHFYPSSFMFTNGLEAKIDDLTYFSFITLSSLGYGDISPVTPPGQSLSIFISICGQMYTAIIIGIIIGKFTLSKKGN